MDKVTQNIREQASEWVIRFQDGDLTPGDKAAFVGWLRASPLNIREYLRAESVWAGLAEIDAGKKLDIDALLREDTATVVPLHRSGSGSGAPAPVQELPGAAAALATSRSRRLFLAAAAVAALAAVPLAYFTLTMGGAEETYTTRVGEQRTVVLEDGSVIELNTASEVTVAFDRSERHVDLKGGEAFFNVKPDADRPFRVYSNGVEIQAVGTQFSVYHRGAETLVTVLEGTVQVQRGAASARAGGEAPLLLSIGHQAVISDTTRSVMTDASAMTRALAWRERKVVFADEPLVNVIAEINRYNTRQLVITDPDLASRRISGVFDFHDPEVIVRFLTRSSAVSVSPTPQGGWILSPGAPGEGSR